MEEGGRCKQNTCNTARDKSNSPRWAAGRTYGDELESVRDERDCLLAMVARSREGTIHGRWAQDHGSSGHSWQSQAHAGLLLEEDLYCSKRESVKVQSSV